MRMLSLAVAGPTHTVPESTEIAIEALHLIQPENLEMFLVDADVSRLAKTKETIAGVTYELGLYVGQNHREIDRQRQDVVNGLVMLLVRIKEVLEQFVEIPVAVDRSNMGGFAMRHDLTVWFRALGEAVNNGMGSSYEEHLNHIESYSMDLQMQDSTSEQATPPPGFENDPAFLHNAEDFNAFIGKKDDFAARLGSYYVSMIQAYRQAADLHLLVHRG